jgi:hypothetical protein
VFARERDLSERELDHTEMVGDRSTQVDMRPQRNAIVAISGQLDRASHVLTWTFRTLDPATGNPIENAIGGFLPADKAPPQGEGSVSFTVAPSRGLMTGARVAKGP